MDVPAPREVTGDAGAARDVEGGVRPRRCAAGRRRPAGRRGSSTRRWSTRRGGGWTRRPRSMTPACAQRVHQTRCASTPPLSRTAAIAQRRSTEPAGVDDPAQELPGARLARVAENLLGRPLLEHPAAVEEAHPVGDLAREAHLVRGDEHGHAVVLQLADQAQHLADEFRVERARHLVEEHQPRPGHQRPRDRDPLLLAAGQLVRARARPVAQPDPLEHRQRRGLGLSRAMPCTRRGASVTLSSTRRCGNRLNAWNTMPTLVRTWLASTRGSVMSSPVQLDHAVVDDLEQVDAAQQRRLARSGRADQHRARVLRRRRCRGRRAPRWCRTPCAGRDRNSGAFSAATSYRHRRRRRPSPAAARSSRSAGSAARSARRRSARP